jgi:hypothetical protein
MRYIVLLGVFEKECKDNIFFKSKKKKMGSSLALQYFK